MPNLKVSIVPLAARGFVAVGDGNPVRWFFECGNSTFTWDTGRWAGILGPGWASVAEAEAYAKSCGWEVVR